MGRAETLSGDTSLPLPEFDAPPDEPLGLIGRWIGFAERAGVREPRAACLATANGAGQVSARTVLVKEIGDAGVVLSFSATSRKGRDIRENAHAAVNFYWRELVQQISISGTIVRAPDEISDRIFAQRPRAAQAAAVRSHQSEPLTDADLLRSETDRLIAGGQEIARPTDWSAHVLSLDEVEFWHGSPDRFHRRLRYRRSGDGYEIERLQP